METTERTPNSSNNTRTYLPINGVESSENEHANQPFFFQLPVGKAEKKNGLMLDLQSGQGNWLVAGSKKKYIPIGLEGSLEKARVALQSIREHNVNGYVVV